MEYKFVKNPAEMQEGEMLITFYKPENRKPPVLTAWIKGPYLEMEEWVTITTNLPGKDAPEGSVFLDHNVAGDMEFVNGLLGYIGEAIKPVFFGPFNTMTYEMVLKDDYENLCFDEQKIFGESE